MSYYYTPVTPRDSGWVYADRPSCIACPVKLETEQGPLSAGEILRRVQGGHRVSFAHKGAKGEYISNPVIDALGTLSKGRTLIIGSRRVTLTDGHVVPLSGFREVGHEGFPSTPIGQQPIAYAGDLAVGDETASGCVTGIVEHGDIRAVRLWTAIPRFISTVDGVLVGTRFHETCVGWVASEDDDPSKPFLEIVGLVRYDHASGSSRSLAWEDTGETYPESGAPVLIAAPGRAEVLARTIRHRGGCLGDCAEICPAGLAGRRLPRVLTAPQSTLADIPGLRAIWQKGRPVVVQNDAQYCRDALRFDKARQAFLSVLRAS